MNKFEKNKKSLLPGTILYHVTTDHLESCFKYRETYYINTYIILGVYKDTAIDVINLKQYQESAPQIAHSIPYIRLYYYDFENIYFSREKAEKICIKFNKIVEQNQIREERRKKTKYSVFKICEGLENKNIDDIVDMVKERYNELNISVSNIKFTTKAINQLKTLVDVLEVAQNSIIERQTYSLGHKVDTTYVSKLPYTVVFDLPVDEESIKEPIIKIKALAWITTEHGNISTTSKKHVFKHYQFYEKVRKE